MKKIFRVLLIAVLFCVCAPVVVGVQGCTGTAAYREAENPAELAYVLAEHYAALVKQAADLRQRPTTPANAIAAMQRADQIAKPIILQLRPLRDAYIATKSAQTEAELQAAADRAVIAIADLVRTINAATRGTQQ